MTDDLMMQEIDLRSLSKQQLDELFDDLKILKDERAELGGYFSEVDNEEVELIQKYVKNTIGPTHEYKLEVLKTYAINQPDREKNFRQDLEDHRLLWHGTKRENLCNILKNGFDHSKAKTGMFSAGYYFTDCVTKSANYASPYGLETGHFLKKLTLDGLETGNFLKKPTLDGYLFLCEVALGQQKTFVNADNNAHLILDGCHSIYGKGTYGSKNENCQFKDGVMSCAAPIERLEENTLKYNEYVVYSVDQIKMKYLVKVNYVLKGSNDEFIIDMPQTPNTSMCKAFLSYCWELLKEFAFILVVIIFLFVLMVGLTTIICTMIKYPQDSVYSFLVFVVVTILMLFCGRCTNWLKIHTK